MDRVTVGIRELVCPMCFFKAKSNRSLVCHCLVRHRFEGSNFVAFCTYTGCKYSTKSYNAYKIHSRRRHGCMNTFYLQYNCEIEDADHDTDSGEEFGTQNAAEADMPMVQALEKPSVESAVNFEHLICKYFLSLETEHKLSKSAIDGVASLTGHLIANASNQVFNNILAELPDNMQAQLDRNGLANAVSERTKVNFMDTMQGFLNCNHREKLYEKLPTFVAPKQARLGTRIKEKGGKMIEAPVYAYYIPLHDLLQLLLKLPEIAHFVRNPVRSTDGLMREIQDCPIAQRQNDFRNANVQHCLRISLFYDDIEIQNPLRANHKHKLAMVYIGVLNLPAHVRSRLKSIFLLGTARSKDIQKYGIQPLLQDFISTMANLSRDGMEFELGHEKAVVGAKLMYAVCDHPAAAYLGGFKESAGFSLKSCRRCYADKNTMKQYFNAKHFRLRTLQEYLHQCKILSDRNLSPQNLTYWSKEFGVKAQSCLTAIHGFDVTSCLVQDPLHLTLEGVCGHLLALFLNKIIFQDEYLSLQTINAELEVFPYAYYDHGSIPEKLQRRHIVMDSYVRQKAAPMLLLCYTLPQILANKLPLDLPHYRHFIYLVQILQLSFSVVADSNSVGELEMLIEHFGTQWSQLYPGSTQQPKLHYMCHLVEQMKNLGNLHGLSTMRFEAKHFFFKDFRWKNFRNLPKSLSEKHQLYLANMCLDVNGNLNNNFLSTGHQVGEGNVVTISRRSDTLHAYLSHIFGDQDHYCCYETGDVTFHGIHYKVGAVLLLDWDELFVPEFGLIDQILVFEEEIIVLAIKFKTLDYAWQWHSYNVQHTEDEQVVSLKQLRIPFPLVKFMTDNTIKIMNRFAHFTGGMYKMVWFRITNDPEWGERVAMRDVQTLHEVIDQSIKKLNLDLDKEYCVIEMTDGTRLTEDDDLKCEDMIGGKLLVIKDRKQKSKTPPDLKGIQVEDSLVVREKDMDQSSVSVKSEGSSTSMEMLQCKSGTSKAVQSPSTAHIRQKEGAKLEPLELPPFTLTVKRGLRDNDSASVWNMMLEQMQHFYTNFYPERLQNSGDYRILGEMMFRRFPDIKREGKHPWTMLTRCLSQRIRSHRFNRKLKDFTEGTSLKKVEVKSENSGSSLINDESEGQDDVVDNESGNPVPKDQGNLMSYVTQDDYVRMMAEARKEAEKRQPNRNHLKLILKQTFATRRKEIKRMDEDAQPMVSSILEDWPCLEFGEYVREELKMVLLRSETQMENLLVHARKNYKALTEVVPKTEKNEKGDQQVMDILRYVFQQVSTKKGKANRKKLPVIAKVAAKGDVDKYIKSVVNESPKLYLFFDENGKFELAEMAADRSTIHLQAHNIVAALLLFIGSFFVFHVGYVQEESDLLGILQTIMLDLPYDGKKTKGYIDLLHKYDNERKKMEEGNKYKKLCT